MSRNALIFCPLITLVLTGCDSSSSSTDSNATYSSSSIASLSIVSASDDGLYIDDYNPSNTIDGDITEESRWVSSGTDNAITFDLGESYKVTSIEVYWYNGDERNYYFDVTSSTDNSEWTTLLSDQISGGTGDDYETIDITDTVAQYITITGQGNSVDSDNSIVEVIINGYSTEINDSDYGLSASLTPSENFDLTDWYVSIPIDEDNSGTADSIYEADLNNGYENTDYFYTGDDGAMVFVCPVDGYKTSTNTSYTRTELREMLRSGDTSISTKSDANNWAFSSVELDDQEDFGGIDGVLTATLAVNHVTSTGDDYQIGRVIIGQIHAASNEPARLYYRLLPDNTKGSIYLAHEPAEGYGDEQWYTLIGSRSDNASDPSDGIELNEKFSYRIEVEGDLLTVTISRDGYDDVTKEVNMSDSGYDDSDNYMYFKAGVYNQNNTGDDDDYVQASFYSLSNSHDNDDD